MHSFSDQSGCVFLDLHSGETLSVLMAEADIFKVLSGKVTLDEKSQQGIAIKSLINKNIFAPFDNNHTDA